MNALRHFLQMTRKKPAKPIKPTSLAITTSCRQCSATSRPMFVLCWSVSPVIQKSSTFVLVGISLAWGNQITEHYNNYFGLAVFRPDEAGHYRRQKTRFQALHAVMLDDIGTKVAEERVTLPPTWMLETSPGNCQAGYLLAEPLADGGVADRLMDALVFAHLCDREPMARVHDWHGCRWR